MAYLNWTKEDLALDFEATGEFEVMKLALSKASASNLAQSLAAVYGGELASSEGRDSEIRIDLPRRWTLFFKRKEGESRLLVAHPEESVWVGTLALGQAHASALLGALASSQGEFTLGELGEVNSVSNFDLKIRFS